MKNAATKKPGRIKSAVLNWLGVPISLTDDQFWNGFASITSTSGACVNEGSVLSLSAAWACTRLIAETIATLPLSIYEKQSSGRTVAPQHPLHMIIHDQPNPNSTAAVFWESMIAAMLLRGMGHAEKLMAGSRLVGLRFLSPSRLSITRGSGGQREYRYTEAGGIQRVIPTERIWAVPGFSIDGECGVSAIRAGANVFGAALAAEGAASATFKNGLMPTVYFKMEKVLTPDQRTLFRESLKEISGSINAGKSPLLEGGMSADTIGINPDDAQLLESRGFSVEEVCRWFRVPPFMVGHSEKSTSWGSGIEQQMIGFLTFTLGPWLKRIEQSISKDLLTASERMRFYPKFAVEGLLRADSAGRATFFGAMVDRGIFTRDEVRELEDRAPMGGNAAVLTVQSAMTTLDSIGSASDAKQTRAAFRAFLGLSEDPTKD